MTTDSTSFCATCRKAENLKKCARCRKVSYCSGICQKADWTKHREVCSFTIQPPSNNGSDEDALKMLRSTPSPPTKPADTNTKSAPAVTEVFNTAELRLSIFSLLPAQDLLVAQRVCRAFYLHVALEVGLQQRLFFEVGPGELVVAANNGNETNWAIKPRDDKQRKFAADILRPGTGSVYHISRTAEGLAVDDTPIILNPFFTRMWPQLPENMTLVPYTAQNKNACYFNREASWRRMQLTSPPTTQLAMSVWFTRPSDGRGNQLRPTISLIESGVTLGHFSDLLDTIPKKFRRHWMSIDRSAWWLQSADALVVPETKVPDADASLPTSTYVNPSNGLAFPGGF